MGSSKGKANYQTTAYNNAFQAAQSGQDWGTVSSNSGRFQEAAQAGYNAGKPPVYEFKIPENMYSSTSSASTAAADAEAAAAERARIQAINERDSIYSNRMDAATSAVDYINRQIAEEQSNAALMGVDYQITDETKAQRINNYFASIWGESDESKLNQLMKDYGNPTGHKGFTVVRGVATEAKGDTPAENQTVATSGAPASTVLTSDEDQLGGSTTTLGG